MRRFIVAAVAAALGLTATAAQATVVEGTFSGVVDFGSDPTNLFGLSGNLGGQTITGTFSYDSAALTQSKTDGATSVEAWADAPTIPLTISETLNNITTVFSGQTYSSVTAQRKSPDGTPNGVSNYYLFAVPQLPKPLPKEITNFTIVYQLFENTDYSFLSDITDVGSANFSNTVSGNYDSIMSFSPTTQIAFRVTAMSAGPVGVPEPLSLALLGVGLAGLGVARRGGRGNFSA